MPTLVIHRRKAGGVRHLVATQVILLYVRYASRFTPTVRMRSCWSGTARRRFLWLAGGLFGCNRIGRYRTVEKLRLWRGHIPQPNETSCLKEHFSPCIFQDLLINWFSSRMRQGRHFLLFLPRSCVTWKSLLNINSSNPAGMWQLQSNYPNNCGKVPDFPWSFHYNKL